MLRNLWGACFALGLSLVLASGPAWAQAPENRPRVSKDPAAAPAGVYTIDATHTSLLARVTHQGGFSYSVIRFGGVAGTLDWKPASPESSKLNVTVDAKSISTPIKFVLDLTGESFLNVAKYPAITFVSTGVRRTGPTTGQISGTFTFRGVSKPVVIDAELVGAGHKSDGTPDVGFHGGFKFKRSEYGMTTGLGSIGDEIEIVLDLEFLGPKPPAPPAG